MKILPIFAILLCYCFPGGVFAEDSNAKFHKPHVPDHYTATEIITQIDQLNGKEVVLRGEAAVEPLERGDFVWLNVFDGSISIGVWMKKELIAPIKFYSGYKTKGDTVEIVGKAYRADPDTNGELDIKATSLKVIEHGSKIPEHFPVWKIVVAIVLLLMTGMYFGKFFSDRAKMKVHEKDTFELGTIFNEDIG